MKLYDRGPSRTWRGSRIRRGDVRAGSAVGRSSAGGPRWRSAPP